jgi:hypothetical protein
MAARLKPDRWGKVRRTLRHRWKDPAFRARNAAAVRDNWKDPAFRARNAAAVRATLDKRWKDPAFRARHAAAVRATLDKRWKDPAFRARHAAASKKASFEAGRARLREQARLIEEALYRRNGRAPPPMERA